MASYVKSGGKLYRLGDNQVVKSGGKLYRWTRAYVKVGGKLYRFYARS